MHQGDQVGAQQLRQGLESRGNCQTELRKTSPCHSCSLLCSPFISTYLLFFLEQLYMCGYDMAWAAFWVVEVMSQPWFGHKRIAFLAASQTFTPQTEVTLLTVHLFKKAFTAGSSGQSSLAGSSDGYFILLLFAVVEFACLLIACRCGSQIPIRSRLRPELPRQYLQPRIGRGVAF